MGRTAKLGVLALLLLSGSSCQRATTNPAPASSGAADASLAALPSLPPLGPPPAIERTEDGIPILLVRPPAPRSEGRVRFLDPRSSTLQWPSAEATDGARAYVAIGSSGPDVVVRDGEVRSGLLRELGVATRGCAAARDGEILLSGVADADHEQLVVQVDDRKKTREEKRVRAREQVVFRIDPQGRVSKQSLPPSVATGDDCRLWMGDAGKYVLGTFGFITWDGERFSEERNFTSLRTKLGRFGGPKLCFRDCNAEETRESAEGTRELTEALACSGQGEFTAYEDWLFGTCQGRAVRRRGNGPIEILDKLPESKVLGGTYYVALEPSGSVVIALTYGFRRYVVWPAGEKALTKERTLPPGDRIPKTSPAVIVRGLSGEVPESNTYAVLLGKETGYGTGGSTVGYSELKRSEDAHRAQVARAREVLKKDALWVSHEAVIDPSCGAHVRSPVGWEGMRIHDFGPPTLPKLSPLAVTRKPACLKLEQVSALPGDPDLLLALSAGELWAAWLPTPLPLPGGTRFGRAVDAQPVVQHPKPGAGWLRIGKADSVAGEDARPEPGSGTAIAAESWQAGGAALIRVGEKPILLGRLGAVTLPPATRPMAVGTADHFQAWGAIGPKLVVCAESCRVLEPGVESDIVAVVPRSETSLILGYADGRVGVYEVPAEGGSVVPNEPLVEPLRALLKKRPSD